MEGPPERLQVWGLRGSYLFFSTNSFSLDIPLLQCPPDPCSKRPSVDRVGGAPFPQAHRSSPHRLADLPVLAFPLPWAGPNGALITMDRTASPGGPEMHMGLWLLCGPFLPRATFQRLGVRRGQGMGRWANG